MNDTIKLLEKLIEDGKNTKWSENSYVGSHQHVYGRLNPSFLAWVARIEQLLTSSVKSNSEPYIYLNQARQTPVEGNFQDKFELAREYYLSALNRLLEIKSNGDVYGELLEPTEANQEDITTNPNTSLVKQTEISRNKVFIVHGHDHDLKVQLEIFLSHVGLKPIVLHREVDSGQTIIEKIESNSDVSFSFILLTPDEISYTIDQVDLPEKERKIKYSARPNVLFEFGYFLSKLGRRNVCALCKGNVSIPSDLSGLIYKKVNGNIEDIGFALIKELKAAGLKLKL